MPGVVQVGSHDDDAGQHDDRLDAGQPQLLGWGGGGETDGGLIHPDEKLTLANRFAAWQIFILAQIEFSS